MNVRLDARWHAVRVANNCSDNGGRRPTRREFDQVHSLAYQIWKMMPITYTQLGVLLCPQTDIDIARSRVWQWVQKGRPSII